MLRSLHIARRLAPWLGLSLAYAALITFAAESYEHVPWETGNEFAAALGLALGVLVVLRTNAANERWWEARKLWGQLINDVRNLILKAQAHAAVDETEHRRFGQLLIDFPESLRQHLRGERNLSQLPSTSGMPAEFPHVPGYIAGEVHESLNRWNREGRLKESLWILDPHARSLLDICGGCERIRNTPLAASFRSLVQWAIVCYIVSSPWPVAMQSGWWGLPALAIGFAFLLGTEITAEVIEEPFGRERDDLPLEDYSQTAQSFVQAALQLPPAARSDASAASRDS